MDTNEYPIMDVMNYMEIINVIRNTLKRIDERLVCHGERVAYIIHEMLEYQNVDYIDRKILFLLSVFHDIGAYKTEEISELLEFETHNVQNHSFYGYLFVKNLTPLKEFADVILYHHTPYEKLKKIECRHREYAELIFLANKIDTLTQNTNKKLDYSMIENKSSQAFNPDFVDLFLKADKERHIMEKIANNRYKQTIENIISSLHLENSEVVSYLKMVVYSIDFRSEYTVTHSINTTTISVTLGKILGYKDKDLSNIYFGALIHDIGKITIPLFILESPDKLSPEETEIMRTHVWETDNIIGGIINEDIRKIAVRHHEKLNGKGYPYKLKAEELTGPQRIVAVADILSALSGIRSYKDVFSKEKTLDIIEAMMNRGDLCPEVCQCVLKNYDEIMAASKTQSQTIIKLYKNISSDYLTLQKDYMDLI
ncbi:MAG: HD domain-containing protein [Clostridiales bacterium]